MQRTKLITGLVFSVMVWLTISISIAFIKGPLVYEHGPFEYFQLASTLLGPLLLAFAGIFWERTPPNPGRSKILINLLTIVLAVFAYFLTASVIARATEVISFFTEANSFSRNTARIFAALALPHMGMTWFAIAKAPHGSLACRVGFASLFMVLGACGLYLAIGLSPLVVWRD